MNTRNLLVLFLVLVLSACSVIAPTPTPTIVPLPPAQHVESAFQWLETYAMMKNNVDWTALRNDTAGIIANAKTTEDTRPAICKALRELKDGNAGMLVPGLETPNFYTGYLTLYPRNDVIIRIDPDSPAEKAGLRVGDLIEQVNGHPAIPYNLTDGFPPCNAKEIDTSTEEHLVIDRSGQSLQVAVERVTLTAGVDPYLLPTGQRFGADAGGIGYIELTTESGTHLEYATDVQKLKRSMDKKPVCGWMVDLRRNVGGAVQSIFALNPLSIPVICRAG